MSEMDCSDNRPLVSVIIPTYGRSDSLPRTIQSVLNQTYDNVEIIVVDDNDPVSEHRSMTESVMMPFLTCGKVKYIKHEKNKNGSAARNTGIRNSDGEFLMFLDDDDVFYPSKIQSQLDCLMSRDSSWAACYTRYERRKGSSVFSRSSEKKEGALLKDALSRNLLILAGSNLMVRRTAVLEVGGFDESFRRNQDLEFLVKILKRYKLAYVDELGLCVYVGNSTSGDTDFEKVNAHYIETFKSEIAQLSEVDQSEVYEHLNLQLFRYYLLSKRDLRKAFRLISDHAITWYNAICYVFYLVARFATKKDWSYRLK